MFFSDSNVNGKLKKIRRPQIDGNSVSEGMPLNHPYIRNTICDLCILHCGFTGYGVMVHLRPDCKFHFFPRLSDGYEEIHGRQGIPKAGTTNVFRRQ